MSWDQTRRGPSFLVLIWSECWRIWNEAGKMCTLLAVDSQRPHRIPVRFAGLEVIKTISLDRIDRFIVKSL